MREEARTEFFVRVANGTKALTAVDRAFAPHDALGGWSRFGRDADYAAVSAEAERRSTTGSEPSSSGRLSWTRT